MSLFDNIVKAFYLLFLPLCLLSIEKAYGRVPSNPEKRKEGTIIKEIVAIDKAIGRGTSARINLMFETISGTLPSVQCDKINELIAKLIIENYKEYFHANEHWPDIMPTVKSAADYIARDYESAFTLFKAEDESFGIEGPVGVFMLGRVTDSPKGFLSYRLQDTFSAGDPYGRPSYFERGLVLDLKTGKPVKLEEIIDKDSYGVLRKMLAHRFHFAYRESRMDYDAIEPSENFTFSKDGVVFMYDAGTIDSLAMGVVILTIPWYDFKRVSSVIQ